MSKKKTNRLIPVDTPPELLDYFQETFEYLWNKGYSAKEIAKELQFDDKENTPWDGKLKVWHVYYFAQKFGLKKRNQKQKSRVC